MLRRLTLSLLAAAAAVAAVAAAWVALPAAAAPFSSAAPRIAASGSLPGRITVVNRGSVPARVLVELRPGRRLDLGVVAPGARRRVALPHAVSARVLAVSAS